MVDDLSESMVEFATGCTRAVRNDGVDFFRFVVLLTMALGMKCSMWKVDVKSAFKTGAYKLEDSEFAALVMKVKDQVVIHQSILNFDGNVIADTYINGITDRFTLKKTILEDAILELQ